MREHIQMQNGHQRNGSRKDFSRIKTSLAIPNLIALALLSPVVFKLSAAFFNSRGKSEDNPF